MGYQQALEKAWREVSGATDGKLFSVRLLSDNYDIDISARSVMSSSCNVPAKDYAAIILLHYLAQKLAFRTLPEPAGEWIDFNSLPGGEGYYPAFKKRTIDRVLAKYGKDPEELLGVISRMPAKTANFGDASVVIYPFAEVGIMIKISKGDEEFGPDANILFDRNISKIFCTEDVVVLTEMVVHQI
jgi:hypothetical protein